MEIAVSHLCKVKIHLYLTLFLILQSKFSIASNLLYTDTSVKKIDTFKAALAVVQLRKLQLDPNYTNAKGGLAPHLFIIIPVFIISFYGMLLHLLYKFAPHGSAFTRALESMPFFTDVEERIQMIWLLTGLNLSLLMVCDLYLEKFVHRYKKGKKTIRLILASYIFLIASLAITFILNIK